MRDWQYPLEADLWRTAAGEVIITDDGLVKAGGLLQPYSHYVCSWTGAQMLSRAGLKGAAQACIGSSVSRHGAASDALLELSCAHALAWSPANHYPLLALIASRMPISSVVVEIGTMHGAAAFALRAGLDEACRLKGFAAIDCPSVVVTYNVVDDSAHNAKDCGVSKDAWMQVTLRGGGQRWHCTPHFFGASLTRDPKPFYRRDYRVVVRAPHALQRREYAGWSLFWAICCV
jgi:hypothetical protein